jgi:hypothetical protein
MGRPRMLRRARVFAILPGTYIRTLSAKDGREDGWMVRTYDPEILGCSLDRRTPVLRYQTLVPTILYVSPLPRQETERDLLPVVRENVPNCLEER